jgi:hypothetical protein
VRLLGIPVALFRRAVAYQEELERECALAVMRPDPSAPGVDTARSLLRIATALRRDEQALEPETELEAAEVRGVTVIDLDLTLPRGLIRQIKEFQAALDVAEELCGRGEMLTIVPAPDVSAFRRWYLDEIVRQLGDNEPRPWGGADTAT